MIIITIIIIVMIMIKIMMIIMRIMSVKGQYQESTVRINSDDRYAAITFCCSYNLQSTCISQ